MSERWGRLARGTLTVGAAAWLATGLLGCGDGSSSAQEPEAERTPTLAIFVYDRSTSISDHQLALAQKLTQQRIQDVNHGDRLAALEVLQRSLEEAPDRWSQAVPERKFPNQDVARDSVRLERFLDDAAIYLENFSDTTGRGGITGTDVLSTMHDVAAEVRGYPSYEAQLYIFSDMLQAGPEINMEGLRRMPPSDWVESAKAEGRLPDLSGVCVMVVGARSDTNASQRVKAFWDEYFEATGATLHDRNWTYRPVRLPVDPCPQVPAADSAARPNAGR